MQGADSTAVIQGLGLTLRELLIVVQIIQATVTSLAVIIGGIWALRKYWRGREGKWNLRVGIDHSVLPYSAEHKLLVLNVLLENIGKIVITPGKKGCEVTVRLLPKVVDRVFLMRADQSVPPLLKEEIIWTRTTARDVPAYEIEPGSSYRHTVPVVVPGGALVEVRAMFWWKDDRDAISARSLIDLATAADPANGTTRVAKQT